MKTKTKPQLKDFPSRSTPMFTPQQVENRLVAVLSPALQAGSGLLFTFAQRTLPGHGIVLRLSSGQEFWLSISEAAY